MRYWIFILLTALVATARADVQLVVDKDRLPVSAYTFMEQGDVDPAADFSRLNTFPWKMIPSILSNPLHLGQWIRVDVRFDPGQFNAVIASIPTAFIGDTTLFVIHEGVVVQEARFGFDVPLKDKAIPSSGNIIPLDIVPGHDYSLVFHAARSSYVRYLLEARFYNESELGYRQLPAEVFASSVLLGVQITLVVFIVLLLLWQFHIEFVFAGIFSLGVLGTTLLWQRLAHPLFGGSELLLSDGMHMLLLSFTYVGGILYMRERLKPVVPLADGYLVATTISFPLLLVIRHTASLGVDVLLITRLITLNGFVAYLLLALLALLMAWRGGVRERLLALAWMQFTLTATAWLFVAAIPAWSHVLGNKLWNISITLIVLWIFAEYLWDASKDVLTQRRLRISKHVGQELSSRLGHEIRTPLNAIIATTDLVNDQIEVNKIRDSARLVRSESRKLLKLVNDVLSFFQYETQGEVVGKQPFRLDKVVSDIWMASFPWFRESRTFPRFEIDPGVNFFLAGDVGALQRIFLNLIEHSVGASPEGAEVLITIKQGQQQHGRTQLICEVKDQGLQIPDSQLPMVFNPYVRTSASNQSRLQGAGLGLALVRRLVSGMDGNIQVESDSKSGTRFCFDLWLELQPQAPNLSTAFAPLAGKRMAFITQLPHGNDQVEAMLSYFGVYWHRFATLEAFLEEHIEVDLVYTDSVMTVQESQSESLLWLSKQCPVVVLCPGPEINVEKGFWLNPYRFPALKLYTVPTPLLDLLVAFTEAVTGQEVVLESDHQRQAAKPEIEVDNPTRVTQG